MIKDFLSCTGAKKYLKLREVFFFIPPRDNTKFNMGNEIGKGNVEERKLDEETKQMVANVEENVVARENNGFEPCSSSVEVNEEKDGLLEKSNENLSESTKAIENTIRQASPTTSHSNTSSHKDGQDQLTTQQELEISNNNSDSNLSLNEPPRSRKNSLTNFSKETIQSIKRKTSNLVAPKNIEVASYCRELINVSFHGQVTVKTELELFNLLDEGNSSYTLAALLQSLHRFLSSFNNVNEFTGDEEEYRYYVQGLMERRNQNDMDKFWKDAKKFVDIFKVRGGRNKYWSIIF